MLFTLTLCLALFASGRRLRSATYSPEQLDQLLGPIALYPDPLVALILPASTVPSDITLAANYLATNGAPGGIDAQPWDPSVKALARYPDVVKWMNGNLDWTQALGAAFAQQPADVMKSVQQLRVQARAAGTLVDTPQQQVDLEGDSIRIVPTQPETIYVPVYDPAVVYETPVGYAGPFITFGLGFPVGAWLGYQCELGRFWHLGGAMESRLGLPPAMAKSGRRRRTPGGRGGPIRVVPARWCAISIDRKAVCPVPGSLQATARRSANRPERPIPQFPARPPVRTTAVGQSRCRGRPARPRRANSSVDIVGEPRRVISALVDRSADRHPSGLCLRPGRRLRPASRLRLARPLLRRQMIEHGVDLHHEPISTMTPFPQIRRSFYVLAAAVAFIAGAAVSPLRADAAGAAGSPRQFSSPEEAVKALVAATKAGDHATVDAILGSEVKDLLSGDPKQDAIEFAAFAKLVGQFSQLVQKADDRFVLNLGDQNWPFPIPLVKKRRGLVFRYGGR